jgi:hypothetical protein
MVTITPKPNSHNNLGCNRTGKVPVTFGYSGYGKAYAEPYFPPADRTESAIGLAMQASVTFSQERADGRWLIGRAFDRRLPDAFVAWLL